MQAVRSKSLADRRGPAKGPQPRLGKVNSTGRFSGVSNDPAKDTTPASTTPHRCAVGVGTILTQGQMVGPRPVPYGSADGCNGCEPGVPLPAKVGVIAIQADDRRQNSGVDFLQMGRRAGGRQPGCQHVGNGPGFRLAAPSTDLILGPFDKTADATSHSPATLRSRLASSFLVSRIRRPQVRQTRPTSAPSLTTCHSNPPQG